MDRQALHGARWQERGQAAGAATGAATDEKPSAVAGSQDDVHGTGSQDASGREDAAGQKEDTDAPQDAGCKQHMDIAK